MAIQATRTLEECEAVIGQGLKAAFEMGRALRDIRDNRLYREHYKTFEDYFQERWRAHWRRAYQLIDAAEVVDIVCTTVQLPQNERQARELAPLKDQPEVAREVWNSLVEEAVKTETPITAPIVREAVRARIQGMAAGAQTELTESTTWMSDAQRQDLGTELMRQRGEFMRLTRDLTNLQAPEQFVGLHGAFFNEPVIEQARLARTWLDRVIGIWEDRRGN